MRVEINTLMAIAIAGAVALQDFFEAAAVVSLFTLSEWLESRYGKDVDAMSAVLALRVDEADLVNKDTQTTQKVGVESVDIDALFACNHARVLSMESLSMVRPLSTKAR